MSTFYIAQVSQSFEKQYSMMTTCNYVTKARYNMETFPIMAKIMHLPTFKVILMSIDKKLKIEENNKW